MNRKRMHRRTGFQVRRRLGRSRVDTRRGAILLIVLGLLSLFMLITISFVLEAGHERRGARAAASYEQQGDPPDAALKMAMYQVIRGPRSPNSVIGPHSLLEDMYGEFDGIVGAVALDGAGGTTLAPRYVMADQFIEITGVCFGPDRKPGVAGVDDQPPNQIIDDVSEAAVTGTAAVKGDDYRFGMQPQNPFIPGSTTYPGMDAVEGYYAGRVITMLTGTCARLSTRIVRYFPTNISNTGVASWVMWLKPFDTVPVTQGPSSLYEPLAIGDTFIINGRPFNGAGFGYNPAAAANSNIGSGQADLGLSWQALFPNTTSTAADSAFPFALTPNPTHAMYRDYLNDRPFVNPVSGSWSYPPAYQAAMSAGGQVVPISVDADEDYDAPDFQNMMLAQRTWIPASPVNGALTGTGSWQVRIPSLHRPELVDYWMRTFLGVNPATTPWSALPAGAKQGSSFAPRLRQRIMLRPDPNDHVYQDLNNNGQWDVGEPNWSSNGLFNPITGPWDVDNDNDGTPDSVWVDLGAPVQTAPDGTQFKPLFAIFCLDMDGRMNLNAHGNSTQYEFANPTSGPSFPYNNPQYVPSAHPGNLTSRTDESNILGLTRYHANAIPPGGSWAVPITLNGPYAASSPANPAISGAADYVYSQEPNSYEPSFPSFPNSAGVGWNKQVGVGLGFSVADINLSPVLSLFPGAEYGYPNTYVRSSRVRWLFEGRYEGYNYAYSSSWQRPPIVGRYGEAHLDTAPNNSFAANRFPWPRPRAGITAFQPTSYAPTSTVSVGLPNATGDDNQPAANIGASLSNLPIPSSNLTQPFRPANSPTGAPALGIPRGNYFENSMVSNAVLPGVSPTTPVVNPGVPIPGYIGPFAGTQSNYVRQGHNGSPIDPNGRLMPGLDLRGQVLYGNMPSIVFPVNELLDDPWELDLSDKAARTGLLFNPTTSQPMGRFEIDKPLVPSDLETILRFADVDNWALAQRAESLFEMNSADPQGSADFRNRVTTESWDIPCPNIIAPPEIVQALRFYGLPTNNLSFGDLVRGKILSAYYMMGSSITVSNATQYAQTLLGCNLSMAQNSRQTDRAPYRAISPDLLLGLRMNINRPFGNGIDDNANGTIDEPLETLQAYGLSYTAPTPGVTYPGTMPRSLIVNLPEPLWRPNPSFPVLAMPNGVAMDTNWDGYLTFTDAFARQEYAKHLYTLMMLVTDIGYTARYPTIDALPTTGTLTPVPISYTAAMPSPAEILHAYRVAQWAVNVVDFRDRDAIMTWFEFDVRPFFRDTASVTGLTVPPPPTATWEVDGLLTHGTAAISADDTQAFRGLVWGMEYPDLLITETTAFHDKAIADSLFDSSAQGAMGKHSTTVGTVKDNDFDQIRIPQGSLFVELYCPGRPNTPGWPTLANAPASGVGSATFTPANYPNPNLPYYPPELYDVTNPITFPPVTAGTNNPTGMSFRQGALVLSKTDPNGIYPVWRLATTTITSGNAGQNVQRTFQQHPDSAMLQPLVVGPGITVNTPPGLTLDTNLWNNYLQLNSAAGAAGGPAAIRQNINLERIAYFTAFNAKFTGTGATAGQNDFFYRAPATSVPGLPPYPNPPGVASTTTPPTNPITPMTNPPYYPYSPNNIFLQPGCYAVVGPYRGSQSEAPVQAGSSNDVTFVGYVNSAKAPASRPYAQYINLQSQLPVGTPANMVVPCINHATTGTTPSSATPTTSYPYPSTVLGTSATQAKIKYPLGIPLAAGTAATNWVGLNISEPNGGYAALIATNRPSVVTTYSSPATPTAPAMTVKVMDSWTPSGGAGSYPDNPWDATAGRLGLPAANATKPGINDDTTIDAATVLLQRLADPTMHYDPYSNPYITVDWMSVDLTVFNGQSSYLAPAATLVNTYDTYTTPGQFGTGQFMPFNFQSRQRGPRVPPNSISATGPVAPVAATVTNGSTWPQFNQGTSTTYAYGWPASLTARPSTLAGPNSGPTNYGAHNGFNEAPLWSSFSDDPQPTRANSQASPSTAVTGQPPFNHYLYCTLGYLNEGYGIVNATGASPGAIDGYFVGGAASRYTQTNQAFNVLYDYIGDPIRPFPWLTWNNRPYANPMELLLVPASSPDRFGWEFTYKTHYTDPIIASQAGYSTYSQYRMIDNHYAPLRNPYWDYFSATKLWGLAPGAAAAGLDPAAPLPNAPPLATATTTPNVASSQTMYPPLQFDPWTDYSHSQPYQNTTGGFQPTNVTPNPPYFPTSFYPLVNPTTRIVGGYPFGHLLNFFASGAPLGNPLNQRDALAQIPAPNYFRLLEFVTVPSPFAGTEDVIFPIQYTGTQAGQPQPGYIQAVVPTSAAPFRTWTASTSWPPTTLTNTRWPLANDNLSDVDGNGYFPFKAPFNRVSRFREPGRVNINTISDRDVSFNVNGTINMSLPYLWQGAAISPLPPMWQGITNDLPGHQQNWYDMKASMSVVDPRGPDRLWWNGSNTMRNDDFWPANALNLYGIGQPASYNTAMISTLGFVNSIEQNLGVTSTLGPLSGAMPTIYTNPFRSYCNPLRAPMAGMWNRFKWSPANPGQATVAPLLFVDATMLRRADPDILYGSEPVFCMNTYSWGQGVSPQLSLGASATTMPLPTQVASLVGAPPTPQLKLNTEIASSYNDPNRNPFFRYYPLQKIGATTTTRSNVYAVWITVGNFEVQKLPANPSRQSVDTRFANPDGYQLVRELYSDIGAAKRSRGFFIFDRSIPVGFMRGETLNVDKAILLRRIIQ